MKLYNKIQELINEIESLKQKNNEVLGLAKNEIISQTTSGTTNALTSKILGILETKLNAITESVIKNLNTSNRALITLKRSRCL